MWAKRGRRARATLLSALLAQRFVGREGLAALLGLHPLEVAEDGPRIDAEVLGGLGPVAPVPLQDLVDVAALPLVARGRQRQDRVPLLGPESVAEGKGVDLGGR